MNELYHYGVPGMKWGVRKEQRQKSLAIKAATADRKIRERETRKIEKKHSINRDSLEKSKQLDKEHGEQSWGTLALTDAYKFTGRAYVESKVKLDYYDNLIKSMKDDTLKAGKDYTMKRGNFRLTDSGARKNVEIARKTYDDALKKYAKEIKEYDYD